MKGRNHTGAVTRYAHIAAVLFVVTVASPPSCNTPHRHLHPTGDDSTERHARQRALEADGGSVATAASLLPNPFDLAAPGARDEVKEAPSALEEVAAGTHEPVLPWDPLVGVRKGGEDLWIGGLRSVGGHGRGAEARSGIQGRLGEVRAGTQGRLGRETRQNCIVCCHRLALCSEGGAVQLTLIIWAVPLSTLVCYSYCQRVTHFLCALMALYRL